MEPRYQIDVTVKTRDELAKAFRTTIVTVWSALNYKTSSPLSQRIRQLALQKGGQWLMLAPVMETIHDADGWMRQYFSPHVMIEADKTTGDAALLLDGEAVHRVKNISLVGLAELQIQARGLAERNG